MVIMHAGRAGRRPKRRGDLFVLEPLLSPQQEHLALHPGQLLQARHEPPLRLAGDRPLVRVAICGPQVVAERYHPRSEEHTSELQSRLHLVCRLLLEKKKQKAISSVAPTNTQTMT